MKATLTPLERDLLACVERLVTACESSTEELTGLEARSTSRIETRLYGLIDCVSMLIQSQTESTKALRGLLNEEASYRALDDQLQKILLLVKDAEEKLKQS